MQNVIRILNKSFGTYNIKGISIEPTYWQAIAIVILLFLLLLTLARLRYIYVEWHFDRHNLSFLFYGFLLALILEGFLLISGRTAFTQLLGWHDAPKPIGHALDLGREKLVDVLGQQSEVPSSVAKENISSKSVVTDYFNLVENEQKEASSQICK